MNYETEGMKLHDAIRFAELAHRGQHRKGSEVQAIIHPMEVLHLVQVMNGSLDVQIAAVLHDTIEDTEVTYEILKERFGSNAADLVLGHSEDKTQNWISRKTSAINEVINGSYDLRVLILADKVANLRDMVYDYPEAGEKLWDRFHQGKEKQNWFYHRMQEELSVMSGYSSCRPVYEEMCGLISQLFDE